MNNGKNPIKKNGRAKLLENSFRRWKTARFQEVITNLKYEGKSSQGKNLKEMETFLHWLNGEILRHRKIEEAVVFPFVKTHLPRLESMVGLFCDQHEELWHKVKKLKFLFQQLQKQKTRPLAFGKTAGKIHAEGIYTACYLQHHLFTENEKVLKVMRRELREDEKRELSERMNRYLERIGNHNGFARG